MRPETGDYYVIENLKAKDLEMKSLIRITSERGFATGVEKSELELWYARTVQVIISPGDHTPAEKWSQYIKEFKDMVSGNHRVWKMTLVSKEKDPEYFP